MGFTYILFETDTSKNKYLLLIYIFSLILIKIYIQIRGLCFVLFPNVCLTLLQMAGFKVGSQKGSLNKGHNSPQLPVVDRSCATIIHNCIYFCTKFCQKVSYTIVFVLHEVLWGKKLYVYDNVNH